MLKKVTLAISYILVTALLFIVINSLGSFVAITAESDRYKEVQELRKQPPQELDTQPILTEDGRLIPTQVAGPLAFCDVGVPPIYMRSFGFPLTTTDMYSCSGDIQRSPSATQFALNIIFHILLMTVLHKSVRKFKSTKK